LSTDLTRFEKEALIIRPLSESDISFVTQLSRHEGFSPGTGDIGIYRHTDTQGLWVGWLHSRPIGCIAGVRYNSNYGFIGLFLVIKEKRGQGYGKKLWKHALKNLNNLPCIGLEAAPERVEDYSSWGFKRSSITTRWVFDPNNFPASFHSSKYKGFKNLKLLEGGDIPRDIVQEYDASREPTPRPHFLSDWLTHPAGKVLALVDESFVCHGFGRIRPCLMKNGSGWRIGPLIANSPSLAELLVTQLTKAHFGKVLIDSPGLNLDVNKMLIKIGFSPISETVRMYRGEQPPVSMKDVYGLACLELG
tara:strand:- start:4269 stop:5183 length:915 start_codon:yes stop_codon:yes gene_type:complete